MTTQPSPRCAKYRLKNYDKQIPKLHNKGMRDDHAPPRLA